MTMQMIRLLKLEELGQFILSILLFNQLEYPWWIYPACLLLPDLSMIGYGYNSRFGAWIYNLFHHKFIAVLLLTLGIGLNESTLKLIGVILFGHASMDRIFGYGLKFQDDFKNTHLGWIGNKEKVGLRKTV